MSDPAAAERMRRHRRLTSAGFRQVSGWLPEQIAARVEKQMDLWREEVEAVAHQAPPRGRPPKAKSD